MLHVLHVSAEIAPWVKTGGLADVNRALPQALRAAGVDVRLLLPALPALRTAAGAHGAPLALAAPFGAGHVTLVPCRLGHVPAWLLDCPAFYDRPGSPYTDASGRDWPDNLERFALLGWAAAQFGIGAVAGWRAAIVHGHDWHAGLAGAYLAAHGGARAASVFTVHNLAYQGQFAAADFATLELPAHFYAPEGLEFYGHVNFMKAGLHYADRITTVSPTYAHEIQTAAFGHGMDGLLRARSGTLHGILNGVDTGAWDPAQDPALAAHYDELHLDGKHACRRALERELGLAGGHGPLVGVVSRLTSQKGLDLLLGCVPRIVAAGARVVLLGAGDAHEEQAWLAAAAAHPGTIAVRLGYDEALAHRIYAAADLFAVPSRFEPCGLSQLYALRYGALPLVRRTGGLADTVRDATPAALANGSATGFVFDDASVGALAAALERAFALWHEPLHWRQVMRTAMRADFSWDAAAAQYLALYRELRPRD